jgi:hypothetical protein
VSVVKNGVRTSLEGAGRQVDTASMDERITLLEREVSQIKGEMASMRDVGQLKSDVTYIKTNMVTKADLQAQLNALEAKLKTWMLSSVLSLLALQVAMFGYLIAHQ